MMLWFPAVVLVLVAAKDASIERHASIDDKAGARLMRQDTSLKDLDSNIQTLNKLAKAVGPDDVEGEQMEKELKKILKDSSDEKSEAAAMLKDEESLKKSKVYKDEHHKQANYTDEDIFHAADEDKSGHLDEKELGTLLEKGGITEKELDWRDHDKNKDGKLSKDEFLAASPAAGRATKPRSLSLLEEHVMHSEGPAAFLQLDDFAKYAMQDAEPFTTDDAAMFRSVDKDRNGFLNESECKAFFDHIPAVKGKALDWHKFDNDKDGQLCEMEFTQAGSVVLESLPNFDSARRLFSHIDHDQDGFLSNAEVSQAMYSFKQLGIPSDRLSDWRNFDYDKDGRLSTIEFAVFSWSIPHGNPHDSEHDRSAVTRQHP